MKARKLFTQEDDLTIIQFVKETPTNLLFAFKQAGEKLGRSTENISAHYYVKLRGDSKIAAVTCGSSKGFTQNVKNVHTKKSDGTMPDQNLKGFMFVMREMLDLSPADRKKIIDFFK